MARFVPPETPAQAAAYNRAKEALARQLHGIELENIGSSDSWKLDKKLRNVLKSSRVPKDLAAIENEALHGALGNLLSEHGVAPALAPAAPTPVPARGGILSRIFGGGNATEIPHGNSDTGAFVARNAAGEIELPEFLKQKPAAAVVAPAAPAVATAAATAEAAVVHHIVPVATTPAAARPAPVIPAGGGGSVPHAPAAAAPKVPFFHPERMGGKLLSGGKKAGAAALLAASVLGIGAYVAMSARGREFREEDRQVAQIPPLLTPQDLMMQAMPQDLAGPADGRGEFEFRNRVNASRGQVLEQPAVNAVQPRMSAIDPQSVAELGAPKPMSV